MIHSASALGSITVTMTTGAPVPIIGTGIPTPSPPPPIRPKSQNIVRNANMPITTTLSLSLRSRFLSAGGIGIEPPDFRASYGGGRDVLRGGMAKCMLGVETGQGGQKRRVQTRDRSWRGTVLDKSL